MKGQHRIINEVLVFGIGIVIVIFVVTGFNVIEDTTRDTTLKDQLQELTTLVASGIVKVSQNDPSSLKVRIPRRLSDERYSLSYENNKIMASSLASSAYKEIFNIGVEYTIIVDVVSDSDYLVISRAGPIITVEGV